jgi:hypothetical protein
MPLALLLRMLVRVAAGLLFWRLASSRRGATFRGRRPVREPARPRQIGAVRRVDALRETGSLLLRLVSLLVLVAATAVLVAAGVGTTVLGPRWLGVVLLLLAAGAVAGAAFDIAAVRRLLLTRRRRRRDSELAVQAYAPADQLR